MSEITEYKHVHLTWKIFVLFLLIAGLSGCGTPTKSSVATPAPSTTPTSAAQTPDPKSGHRTGTPRGYQTTPQELKVIASKAQQGVEPYHSAVALVLEWAEKEWNYELKTIEYCETANEPLWNDNGDGIPVLYSKALAYSLTGDARYAEEVKHILERIMKEVKTVSTQDRQCMLNFGWSTPELIASADLIEDIFSTSNCSGPTSTQRSDVEIGYGNCKVLFQNWLVKNPYYVVSYAAGSSKSNAGAAATNAIAHIADYLWDRSDVFLIHRNPAQVNNGQNTRLTPSQVYAYANKLALDRMNGYSVEYGSSFSCDYLDGEQQSGIWPPVKSQITEMGIIPEEARREEHCNIPKYNGEYQNYPQIHLGNNIQQCELMLRRGDASCFKNVDTTDIPNYTFIGPDGELKTTHLYPGRGSIERAIKAIIIDSTTEWKHDGALRIAFHYYYLNRTLPGVELWATQFSNEADTCGQDVCFGTLTHGFSLEEELPAPPPTVPPP